MAFDQTKPADDSLIKDGPQLIRDNWDGIVEGQSSFKPWAINFLDRASDGSIANDPTAIADTIIAFSKQDASGKPQLYSIDPDSVIRQLTGNVTTDTVVIGVTTYTHYTVVTPWGITFKFGLAEASPTGVDVSFAPKFSVDAYGIVLTVRASGTQANSYDALTKSGFKAYCASGQQAIAFFAWGV